jgi:hypothetical protein
MISKRHLSGKDLYDCLTKIKESSQDLDLIQFEEISVSFAPDEIRNTTAMALYGSFCKTEYLIELRDDVTRIKK